MCPAEDSNVFTNVIYNLDIKELEKNGKCPREVYLKKYIKIIFIKCLINSL